MQLKLLIYFLLFHFTLLYSQKKHEIGIFIGKFNLISNIGKNIHTEIIPINWNNNYLSRSVGFNYFYNLNLRENIKLYFFLNEINFNNVNSMNYYIYKNNKENKNLIASIGLNFNYFFWTINRKKKIQIIPYIFGGLEIINYKTTKNNYNYNLIDNKNNKIIKYNIVNTNKFSNINSKITFSLNSGIGIKLNFNKNFIFFTECELHPTFINDLDYNFNKQNKINYIINDNKLLSQSYLNLFIKKFQNNLQEKKIKNNFINDWYIITGVGITYTFS